MKLIKTILSKIFLSPSDKLIFVNSECVLLNNTITILVFMELIVHCKINILWLAKTTKNVASLHFKAISCWFWLNIIYSHHFVVTVSNFLKKSYKSSFKLKTKLRGRYRNFSEVLYLRSSIIHLPRVSIINECTKGCLCYQGWTYTDLTHPNH